MARGSCDLARGASLRAGHWKISANAASPIPSHGRVAEWSIAAVLKTAEPQGSGGSNPSPSASFLSEAVRKPSSIVSAKAEFRLSDKVRRPVAPLSQLDKNKTPARRAGVVSDDYRSTLTLRGGRRAAASGCGASCRARRRRRRHRSARRRRASHAHRPSRRG